MFDWDTWSEIISAARKNPLRTFLTACGVFWGIFMLIVMLGMGAGFERGVASQMRGFAANSVYVWGQRTSVPYQGLQPGRYISYTNQDAEAIRTSVSGIKYFAPRVQLGGWRSGTNVVYRGRTGSFSVMGDYPEIQHIQLIRVVNGRFLNDLDVVDRRKVAVIGKAVFDDLFESGANAVGEYIRINGVYFLVVGVFRSLQSGNRGDRASSTIFTPITSFQAAFNVGDRLGWFAITAQKDVSASALEKSVREVLKQRHKVAPADEQAIGSFNADREFGKVRGLFRGIRLIVWFVGIVTLLAGVIGVSNIMLIVVNERTREIGVRKAVGATPLSIVRLILQEAVALTSLAGYLGVAAAVGLLELLSWALGGSQGGAEMLKNPTVDFSVALTATIILVVSGAIAGIIPAQRAARINPVRALRGE